MSSISLDGEWLLYHYEHGTLEIETPADLLASGLVPIPARVPGNVELDLQRAGALPDPFVGANIRLLRPFEFHDWWYRREFDLPAEYAGQRVELVCEGLDTFATIWVNGQEAGVSLNMLTSHRYEVTNLLQAGQANEIVIRLASAMVEASHHTYDVGVMSWEHRWEGLYVRKAAHMWGWDIMPRAVSAGIWRPLRLQTIPEHTIEQLYYWTIDANPQQAVLGIRFQVRLGEPISAPVNRPVDGLVMRFEGVCREHRFEYAWPLEFIADGCNIPIPGAKLWWPAGYGEPNLYTITAQLRRGDEVLAERVERVGLRKLEVDRTEIAGQAWTPEPAGEPPARVDTPPLAESHFVIRVNSEPVMIKGTNWVPLDAFHSRDTGRLAEALEMVADLGCNSIRCWGGNVYEQDAFFDWCDAHGVLVWQDFAFACCIYPQNRLFLTSVRREVEKTAQRLRNHACLAVWCGDNEIDMAYHSQGRDPGRNRLTREIIPLVLERLDPQRAYIPSSPYIPPALVQRADAWTATPEQHLWGPRGYYKSPFYTKHSAHFIGEIGYHGCPNVSSIERFITPEHLWPWQDNDEWQVHAVYHWNHHAIERDRIQLMADQIRELFGEIPQDLPAFALASQITQAEAKKFFIESTRLRKWQTSGILWWNLLDGWPQFSDAVVDYYFGKKLAYHYIRRAQQPVCVFISEPTLTLSHNRNLEAMGREATHSFQISESSPKGGRGGEWGLPLIASNDSLQDAEIHYRVWDADSGQTAAEGDFHLPANQNWQLDSLPAAEGEQKLFLIEWQEGDDKFGNHYLYGAPPFSLERTRGWLAQIAALPRPFEVAEIAR
jgi:beta-mannosidase